MTISNNKFIEKKIKNIKNNIFYMNLYIVYLKYLISILNVRLTNLKNIKEFDNVYINEKIQITLLSINNLITNLDTSIKNKENYLNYIKLDLNKIIINKNLTPLSKLILIKKLSNKIYYLKSLKLHKSYKETNKILTSLEELYLHFI
jgi:hypothetical protein